MAGSHAWLRCMDCSGEEPLRPRFESCLRCAARGRVASLEVWSDYARVRREGMIEATGDVVPYVEYPAERTPLAVRNREAAVAAGSRRLRASGCPEGALVPAANTLGGAWPGGRDRGPRHLDGGESSGLRRALRRLLQHLGALRGVPPPIPDREFYGRGHLTAPPSGLLRLPVRLGDVVEPGIGLRFTICTASPVAELRAVPRARGRRPGVRLGQRRGTRDRALPVARRSRWMTVTTGPRPRSNGGSSDGAPS